MSANRLAAMTWQDAEAAFSTAALAILPVRSIEQHGPHLSLETDSAIAGGLAERLAGEMGQEAILCPRLDHGLSEHHVAFAGTLTRLASRVARRDVGILPGARR